MSRAASAQPAQPSNKWDPESYKWKLCELRFVFYSHPDRSPFASTSPPDPMDDPSAESRQEARLPPNRQRITSKPKAKVSDLGNCPHRVARPESNYNLASFGGGKNGVDRLGQAWTGFYTTRILRRTRETALKGGCPGWKLLRGKGL